MKFLHVKNLAEFHDWFAWHPVSVIRRTPAGPQFYTVWLTTVRRKLVIVQGLMHWTYDFKMSAPPPVIQPVPAKKPTWPTCVEKPCTYEQLIERMSEQGCTVSEQTVDELCSSSSSAALLFISKDVLDALALSDPQLAATLRDTDKTTNAFYFSWRGQRVYTEPSAENLIIRFDYA